VFEYAWKPFYLNHRHDDDAKQTFATVFTAFTAVCGAIFLVTSLFIEYVVQLPFIGGRFVNPEYWDGLTIIPVVMFAYFFNGVFINMAAGLHIEKRTGFFPIATITAAIVSVFATWLLVPPYGIMGAAWAKVLAYVVSAVMLFEFSQRVYPIRYEWGKVGVLVSSSAIAYLGVISAPLEGNFMIAARVAVIAAYSSVAFMLLGGRRSSIKGLFRR